jgi:integrase
MAECASPASSGHESGVRQDRLADFKGAKSRTVPLTARVVEMLGSLGPEKAGYVFHRTDGSQLYQTWVNEQHAAARNLLKLPDEFVPHTFRHYAGFRTIPGEASLGPIGGGLMNIFPA